MVARFDPMSLVDLAQQTVRTSIKVASWGERQVFGFIQSEATPRQRRRRHPSPTLRSRRASTPR
jgi:hypothetical protein